MASIYFKKKKKTMNQSITHRSRLKKPCTYNIKKGKEERKERHYRININPKNHSKSLIMQIPRWRFKKKKKIKEILVNAKTIVHAIGDYTQLESRSRGWETQEGPSTETPIDVGIAEIHGVLQLVEPVLENSEPEEKPDQYHHQYQARA